MLLRRYGNSVHSVLPSFDANALTEIGFRRDRAFSLPTGGFEDGYEKIREESLHETTDGPVQSEAEALLLRNLQGRLDRLVAEMAAGEVALIESEQGVDWPKVRDRKQGIIVEGENRLHFHWRVEPPLRVGVYRRRSP